VDVECRRQLLHPLSLWYPPCGCHLQAAAQEKLRSVWGSFNEATLASALSSALVGHSRIHIIVLTLTATPDWRLLFASLVRQRPGWPGGQGQG